MHIKRYWINRLYEALNPSVYYLGTVANLDVALIPEAERAIDVVKSWSRDFLYSQRRMDTMLLTTVYQTTNLCFFLDKPNALQYIHRAPVFDVFDVRSYCRSLGGDNPTNVPIVRELACSLQCTDERFILGGVLFVK
jgi:hypothetical protein